MHSGRVLICFGRVHSVFVCVQGVNGFSGLFVISFLLGLGQVSPKSPTKKDFTANELGLGLNSFAVKS